MITGKLTAFCAAIFLVTISQAEAKRHIGNVTTTENYCSDSQCGYSGNVTVQVHKQKRISKKVSIRYKVKKEKEEIKKPIQVASADPNATVEAPRPITNLLGIAKSYLGSNPTGWRSLWCARFIAYIAPAAAERLKRMGLNPNWARDYARLPGAKRSGSVGDIVVLTRGRGGHIGIVESFKNGNPIIVSGNHGHQVGRGMYSKSRVIAYVSL